MSYSGRVLRAVVLKMISVHLSRVRKNQDAHKVKTFYVMTLIFLFYSLMNIYFS
jgi:hypothetical protein